MQSRNPSRLSLQWLCGSSCTWAHDGRLDIAGTSDICIPTVYVPIIYVYIYLYIHIYLYMYLFIWYMITDRNIFLYIVVLKRMFCVGAPFFHLLDTPFQNSPYGMEKLDSYSKYNIQADITSVIFKAIR